MKKNSLNVLISVIIVVVLGICFSPNIKALSTGLGDTQGICPNVNYYRANQNGTLNYDIYLFLTMHSNNYLEVTYVNSKKDYISTYWSGNFDYVGQVEKNYIGNCANWIRLEGWCYVKDKDNFDFSSIKNGKCLSKTTGEGNGEQIKVSDGVGPLGICKNTNYYKINQDGTLDYQTYLWLDYIQIGEEYKDAANLGHQNTNVGTGSGSIGYYFMKQYKPDDGISNRVESNYEGLCANWIRFEGSCYVKDKDKIDLAALSNNMCLSISSISSNPPDPSNPSNPPNPSNPEPEQSRLSEPTTPDSHEEEVLNVVYIVGMILLVIRVVVPILLIVVASIALIKAMASKDEASMKPIIKATILKVISAIIIFLIPTLVAILMRLVNQSALWDQYATCIQHPTTCNTHLWEEIQ